MRTSVSRSYYCAFLKTKEKMELRLRAEIAPERPGDAHQIVIDTLKDWGCGPIATKIEGLRRWRTWADYKMARTIDQKLSKDALALAKDINQKVDLAL